MSSVPLQRLLRLTLKELIADSVSDPWSDDAVPCSVDTSADSKFTYPMSWHIACCSSGGRVSKEGGKFILV